MEIYINKKWKITGNTREYILHETVKKTVIKYYFTSLSTLIEKLINKKVKSKNIETLSQMNTEIKEISKKLENIFISST